MKPDNNTKTVLVVNNNDEIVSVTDVGIPGMIAYSEEDVKEELENMDAYRADQNLWREDEEGGIGLNYGDW